MSSRMPTLRPNPSTDRSSVPLADKGKVNYGQISSFDDVALQLALLLLLFCVIQGWACYIEALNI